jgi:voltage-gated potassium channel
LLGALCIMAFEDNMETFADALWWSLVTTTTVGYGDISPETTGGRILAGILMIVGIGFLGMVTGSIATYFVDRLSKCQEEVNTNIVDEQINYVKGKLDIIETLSDKEMEYLWKTLITIKEAKLEKTKEVPMAGSNGTIKNGPYKK